MAIELEINRKTFEVPFTWSEVTLRQFIDCLTLKKDTGFSELDVFVKTLAILANNNELEDAILELDVDSFNQIKDAFKWLATEPEKTENPKQFFEIDGKTFSMKKEYSKLTVGEAISIEMLMKDKKLDIDPLEISFAVLFREVIDDKLKEFDSDTMFDMLNTYSKQIKVTDVYEVINFFLSGEKTSYSNNLKASFVIRQKEKM